MMVLDVPGLEGVFVPPAAQAVAVWPHGRVIVQELPGLNSAKLRPTLVRVSVSQHVHSAGVLLQQRRLFTAIDSFT